MGRYRSIQATLIDAALKGITDNQTVTAYKKDCKLFAAYCKDHGVKRPDQLQGREKELLQAYEKELEAAGYSAATIHRRLAAPCKGIGVSMSEIEKPKRTSGKITRSRNEKANRQGKREIESEKYNRLVTFQRAVGIRRAELARLTGADLVIDEKGYYDFSAGEGGDCIRFVARTQGMDNWKASRLMIEAFNLPVDMKNTHLTRKKVQELEQHREQKIRAKKVEKNRWVNRVDELKVKIEMYENLLKSEHIPVFSSVWCWCVDLRMKSIVEKMFMQSMENGVMTTVLELKTRIISLRS